MEAHPRSVHGPCGGRAENPGNLNKQTQVLVLALQNNVDFTHCNCIPIADHFNLHTCFS